VYSRLRGIQYQGHVLVAVFGVLARRWIARRGRAGEVGYEGAVAAGVAAWRGSPELRASVPAMLCCATSRVGRGRGLLGLTPPQPPGVAEKATAYAMAKHRDSGHGESTSAVGASYITLRSSFDRRFSEGKFRTKSFERYDLRGITRGC
jgi:hypothetical protein